MTIFTWLWILWFALFLGVETAAILSGHGTLSAHVWHLLAYSLPGRILCTATFGWLSWHWFLEQYLAPRWQHTYADDGIIAGLFAALAFFTRRKTGATRTIRLDVVSDEPTIVQAHVLPDNDKS